ncbi:hypothetical protein F5Y15DRAFT_400270 [Xylariaceae sp. FL0016]|nr:hypothetical protein F5Y15DRAFT_400270 [Xylariaceae sp. FL0016]
MRSVWASFRARPQHVRQIRRIFICLFILLLVILYLRPYDSRVWLAIHWNFGHLVRPSLDVDRFFSEPAPFPVDLTEDVAYILKTGYSTQERAAAWLRTLEDESVFRDLLLVADFSTHEGGHLTRNGVPIAMDDVVALTMAKVSPLLRETSARAEKHADLTDAIARNDTDAALALATEFGYQMDALKFISSLDLAYQRLPHKKWYVLVDDDTYLVRGTLRQLLGQLDSEQPFYLGNAIGGWNWRFAHGGSAVLLSQGAMRKLYVDNPDVVSEAYRISITHGWGDGHLAETLMKVRVYVEEGYRRVFNGENPYKTMIRPDRFCDPIVSFHNIKTAAQMEDIHGVYGNISEPSTWREVWGLLGAPSWEAFEAEPQRGDWDHILRPDDQTLTVEAVADAEACLRLCSEKHQSSCLAWTYFEDENICQLSPWMMVGEKTAYRVSGIHVKRARELATACQSSRKR